MTQYMARVDGAVLFSNTLPLKYSITSGVLSAEINSAAHMEFTLPPVNTMRDSIVPHKSVISLERDGKQVFRGIVTGRGEDFVGNMQYTVDDLLVLLGDIITPPFVSSYNVTDAVRWIINTYNAGVTTDKAIRYGNVTVTGNHTFSYPDKCVSLFDVLKDLVSDRGGYIRLRYEDDGVYLDYSDSIGAIGNQAIRFGENLLNLDGQLGVGSLVSRVWPIGRDGLTIESVNNGLKYLINPEVEEKYGRKDKTVSVDSDDASVVKQYGQAYLTRYAVLRGSLVLTAVDLSTLDKTLTEFDVGDTVQVVSPMHGLDTEMQVTAVTVDLVSPSKSSVTLGDKSSTLTDITASIGGYGDSEGDRVIESGTDTLESYGDRGGVTQTRTSVRRWRKWSSGIMEQWVSYSVSGWSTSTAFGGMKRTSKITAPPFKYPYLPEYQVNTFTAYKNSNGYPAWTWEAEGSTINYPTDVYLVRPDTQTLEGRVITYTIGKWK